MTLFLHVVKCVLQLFSSGISLFVQIFPAINNRALIPLPSAIGRRDGYINPYTNTTGTSGASSTLTLSFMKKNLRLLLAGLVMTFLTLSIHSS